MGPAILIVFIVVFADGHDTHSYHHRDSLDACWAEARQFAAQDPSLHGGVALGAGCFVMGQPA